MLLDILGWRRSAYAYGSQIIYLASGVLEMSDSRGGGTSGGTAGGRGRARTTGRTERIAPDAAVGHVHVMMLSIHDAGHVSQVIRAGPGIFWSTTTRIGVKSELSLIHI